MKTKIWKWFEKNQSKLLLELKKTYHAHSNGNENPFHLENDCLSHTKLVYENLQENEKIELYIATILHDIGKIYTRKEKQTGKVSFFGHANVSTIYAIDILKEIELEYPKINKKLILELIAWHGLLWNKKDKTKERINKLINEKFSHEGFYEEFVKITKADALGRKTKDEYSEIEILEEYKYFENYIPYNKNEYSKYSQKQEVIMLIGISGSGKSTYIDKKLNKKEYKIISTDNYLTKGKLNYNNINYKKEVQKAHKEVLKDIKECVLKEKDAVIDMTNLSIENRRKKLSLFPSTKYKKIAIIMLKGIKEISENLKEREKKGKTISKEVIKNQIESFELPGLDEFDEIKYIF